MRFVTGILLVGMLALLTGVSLAAPGAPPDAKEWHYILNQTRATYPEVEPNDTCPEAMQVQCGDVVDPASISATTDVDWYKITLQAGQMLTVATDQGTLCGSPYVVDSVVYLYYNCGSNSVTSDDDGGPGLYSLMTYTVPAGLGGEYEVKVVGYGTHIGCYKVSFACEQAPEPPPNDTCASAIDIPRCTSGQLAGNTSLAANDYTPGSGGCTGYGEPGKDVVYTLVLQAGDVVDLSYTQTSYDAAIYLITDCADAANSCVIGADDTYSGEAEVINWTCDAAGTYYLILDSYSGGGPWTLDYAITCSEPTGACCAPDGGCTVTLQANCGLPSIWHSEWASCTPDNPCPQPMGACCAPDGSCTTTTALGCATPSIWHGEWTDCSVAQCPQPPTGACCDRATGACTITTQAHCGFDWLGENIPCNTDVCPPPLPPTGACCDVATGACTITTALDCHFQWLGEGIACTLTTCPVPPPPTGACCDVATGVCTITAALDCHFQWLGAGIPCNLTTCPVPPPPVAACCDPATGACAMRTQAQCQAPMVWHAGVSCTPSNPCQQPVPVERSTWGQIKSNYR